mgnify:CR=1 FL=1
MLKKTLLGILSLLMFGQMALVALPAGAACDPSTGNSLDCLTATNLGNGGAADAGQSLPVLVGRIIRTLLGLLGAVSYAAVLELQAHGVVLRSPYAHAALNGVDVTAARAAPGVHAVITAADLAEYGDMTCAMPLQQICFVQGSRSVLQLR